MKDSDEQVKPGRVLDPVIEAYKKHIDVTLIRENLRLTVDQRFQQLMKLRNSPKTCAAPEERPARKSDRLQHLLTAIP